MDRSASQVRHSSTSLSLSAPIGFSFSAYALRASANRKLRAPSESSATSLLLRVGGVTTALGTCARIEEESESEREHGTRDGRVDSFYSWHGKEEGETERKEVNPVTLEWRVVRKLVRVVT